MGDRGPILRVQRALIAAGVATEETTADELAERASHLMQAINRIDDALRPAMTPDGRGADLSTGDLMRRLAAVADAAIPKEQ